MTKNDGFTSVAAPPGRPITEQQAVPATPSARAGDKRIVGAFMFGHFTHHVANTMLAPLLPLIRDGFGLSYPQSGFLVSAYSVSQGLSQAPLGALADRIGSRTVVVWGLFGTALFCFLIGLSADYWQVLLALVGLGIIAGTYHAPANTLLAQSFPRQRLGGVLGMHTVGGNLSFFATPLLAGGLAALTLTWRTPYLSFALVPFLAGLFLMFVLPPFANGGARATGHSAFVRELGAILRVIGPLLGVAIVFQMLYASVHAFMALYLVDARGFDPPIAAVAVSVPFIGGLLGSPLGGYLSDRLGRKRVIVFALVCLGPLLLLFTLAPTPLLIPIMFVTGLVSSARQPVIEGLLLERAPADRRATTLGAYYFVAQELGGFAAPVLGALAGLVGIGQAFTALAMAMAAASVLLLVLQHKL